MKPEKPAVPESLVAMWVFIGFAITAFIGYLGARGDGLDWYVSLPLPPGAIPAWAFGPSTVLIAGLATYAVIAARRAKGEFNRPVFFLAWLVLGLYSLGELLLFGSRHLWLPATITFGLAGAICLFIGGLNGPNKKIGTAVTMTILTTWFLWATASTNRTYRADKDTVPNATVTDSGASSPSPPPPRRK